MTLPLMESRGGAGLKGGSTSPPLRRKGQCWKEWNRSSRDHGGPLTSLYRVG